MPRPRKCRKVCCLPINDGFLPVRGEKGQQPVILKVDEYEALRLIDREGFSQEECGDYMHIARATVQQSTPVPAKSWRMCWWRADHC